MANDNAYSKWEDYCFTCMNKLGENRGCSFKDNEYLQRNVISVVPLWLIYFGLSSVLCLNCVESVNQYNEFMIDGDNVLECPQEKRSNRKGTGKKCTTCQQLYFADLVPLLEVTQSIYNMINRDIMAYLKWPRNTFICIRCSWVLHAFAGFRLACEQSLVEKICTQPDRRGIVEFIPNRQRPMPYKFCTRSGQIVSEVSDNPIILQLYNELLFNMKQQSVAAHVLPQPHPKDQTANEQKRVLKFSESRERNRIVKEITSKKDEFVCHRKNTLKQPPSNCKFEKSGQPKQINDNVNKWAEEFKIEESSNLQGCVEEAETGNAPNFPGAESQAKYSYLFGWNEGHADTTLNVYDKQTPVIPCEWCPFTCSSIKESRLHFATHSQAMGAFKFRCRYCCSFFRNRKDHTDHERFHKEQMSLPEEKRALLER